MYGWIIILSFLNLLLSPLPVIAATISLELIEQKEYLSVKTTITGLEKTTCKDKTCYLQAMFTSLSANKYFGYTFGQNDWFAYVSSPEKEFIKSNFVPFDSNQEGTWSGTIQLKNNQDDTDYKGPGKYLIKVKRYTGESTSAATDDLSPLEVELNEVTSTPTQTPSPQPTVSPSSTVTVGTIPTTIHTPTILKTPTSLPTRKETSSPEVTPVTTPPVTQIDTKPSQSATASTILGTSTTSPTPIVDLSKKTSSESKIDFREQPNPSNIKLTVLGSLMVSGCSGYLLYRRLKRY